AGDRGRHADDVLRGRLHRQGVGDGASGFLLKSGDPRELLAGVHAVAGGAAYLSPKVAKRVLTELATTGPGGRMSRAAAAKEQVRALTARERDVLALIGAGFPTPRSDAGCTSSRAP